MVEISTRAIAGTEMAINGGCQPMLSVVAARPQRDGELRVTFSNHRDRDYLNVRWWFRDRETGELLPGKGLSIGVGLLPWLRGAIERAEEVALEGGLLDEEAYRSAGREVPAFLGEAEP